MKKWFSLLGIWLAGLAAPGVGHAQNSFNQWTAARPAPITPLPRKTRPVAKKAAAVVAPAPKPAPEPAAAPLPVAAPPTAPPAAIASTVPVVKQSRLLKRGLTNRMRQNHPLPEDSVSMVFFAQNSEYPRAAIEAGAQGKVVIRLQIAPDGQVTNTSTVVKEARPIPGWSNTPPDAAMEALAKEAQRVFRMLRFEPANKATEEELVANFSLQ